MTEDEKLLAALDYGFTEFGKGLLEKGDFKYMELEGDLLQSLPDGKYCLYLIRRNDETITRTS